MQLLREHAFSIAYECHEGEWSVANYCTPCLDGLLGLHKRKLLVASLSAAGWVQTSLDLR